MKSNFPMVVEKESNKVALIVQPWFSSNGHPAQSTLHLARLLGSLIKLEFVLIGRMQPKRLDFLKEIGLHGAFEWRSGSVNSIRLNTLIALVGVLAKFLKQRRYDAVLFVDAHLVLLAIFWPMFRSVATTKRFGSVYLFGPEKIERHGVAKYFVHKYLMLPEVFLCVRTQELAQAWRLAFPNLGVNKILVIPPSEMGGVATVLPDNSEPYLPRRFGIVGQLRPEKGIKLLANLFSSNSDLGILTVAGAFGRESNRFELESYCHKVQFYEGYLSEKRLNEIVEQQHYLLALHENWDERMEVATLYLAVRNNRPVVCYEGGWCARKVREFRCGFIFPKDKTLTEIELRKLPSADEIGYRSALAGLARFRSAHSNNAIQESLVGILFDKNYSGWE